MKKEFIPMIGAVCFLTGCGGGSKASVDHTGYVPPPSSEVGSSSADALRVGDVLDIRLTGVPLESSGVYQEKIDEIGLITMPYLAQPFKALGLSTSQLKAQIEQAYRAQKIFSTPNVSIIAQPRFINVNGEVRSPQRVQFTTDLTALGAISACGGFTDYAEKKRINILRNRQIIEFNAVEAQRNPSLDQALLPGDQIVIKRTIF